MSWSTKRLASEADDLAPDGSEVRLLSQAGRGSMAIFTLGPKAVSKAVAHHTIEEVWLFLSGHGRMWRRVGETEETVDVGAGVSISIPIGTHFQFRSDTFEPLVAVGVTMPPWPGPGEAYFVEGPWRATA